jgi:hypothetical protein
VKENAELKPSQAKLETQLAELQLKVTEITASDRSNKSAAAARVN